MKEPGHSPAHDAPDDEFQLAKILIESRKQAGLAQDLLARWMKTSQSYVARLESGQARPSTDVLERLGRAAGTGLKITFEPAESR